MIVSAGLATAVIVAGLAPEWALPVNSALLLAIAVQQQLARRQAAREDQATREVRAAEKRRRAR